LRLPSGNPESDPLPGRHFYERIYGAAIITGRGCPHRCPYCAVHVLKPAITRREPDAVVDEIERIVKDFGIFDVASLDDSLRAGGDGHLISILEEVTRRKVRARFHAINAIHLADFSPSFPAF